MNWDKMMIWNVEDYLLCQLESTVCLQCPGNDHPADSVVYPFDPIEYPTDLIESRDY
jgi:hypothetical protein